jgi:ABC-2 type transport system ATP-binding protein
VIGDAGGVLSGISKRFSRRGPWVLNGVDLDLNSGSRTVVVGDNGSGKSTLLRIAAGVSHPTGGQVILPATIGYVPERLAARSKMTGTEYITHMGRIKGLNSKTINARSRELLERLNLQPGPTELIDALSKGNRQKLVLAQALLGPAGLLVLDEPFSGLDPAAHRSLDELIGEAQTHGTSVLISAHQAHSVPGADRTLGVGDGHLVELANSQLLPQVLEQHVELVATVNACADEQIAALPGVRSIRRDKTGAFLSLVVEQARTDYVLSAVIALGWSVASVGRPGGGLP